jgi:hypothetical protein
VTTGEAEDDDAVELPIDGELDLHTFAPREVAALVDDYLDACKERGITDIRIVHGKGKGVLRRTVHAVLERRDDLIAWGLAPPERGGWGATLVTRVGGTPPAGLVSPDALTEGGGRADGDSRADDNGADGDSRADDNGADDNGADDNGADDNGADDNGADDNGADDNGADDNGADDNGADRDRSPRMLRWLLRWLGSGEPRR